MTKYIPNGNTKIVIDGVTYQNNGEKKAVLPVDKIGEKETERLLKGRYIQKLELDEGGAGSKTATESKRDKLLASAKELGIEIEDSMTDAEIEQKIKDVTVRAKLVARAKELGIEVKDEMSNEEIQKAIKAAK